MQQAQLDLAPDHLRLDTLDALRPEAERAWLHLGDDVDLDRILAPADAERLSLREGEDPADQGVGFMRNEDPARRRGVLEPAGERDRRAARGVGPAVRFSLEKYGAGRDPRRERKRALVGWLPLRSKHFARLGKHPIAHGQCGPDRVLGVVLAGLVSAPQDEARLTGVTMRRAGVPLRELAQGRPKRVHRGANALGVRPSLIEHLRQLLQVD